MNELHHIIIKTQTNLNKLFHKTLQNNNDNNCYLQKQITAIIISVGFVDQEAPAHRKYMLNQYYRAGVVLQCKMPTICHYTGDAVDAMCPITLTAVQDLTHPVALQPDYSQPYELAALWRWVLSTKKHPLTGNTCSLNSIATLDLPGARMTESVLEGMLQTAIEEKEYKDRISELADSLDRLSRSIALVHRDTLDIQTEKLALEQRFQAMQVRFSARRAHHHPHPKNQQKKYCIVC